MGIVEAIMKGGLNGIIIKRVDLRGGGTALEGFTGMTIAVVQTKPKAPDPIRTPKLSGIRNG